MGDRIAVLREGGRVAQYATPAELLMAPADDFVEDFVGADRALKRLALLRVSDIDLWEAPLAFVGQSTAEVRAEARGSRGAARAGRGLRAPAARLALRRRPGTRARARAARTPGPSRVLERDDVMRDALSDLLQAETRYAPVVDARRPDRRGPVGRDHLRVPHLHGCPGGGARRPPSARWPERAVLAARPDRRRASSRTAPSRTASPRTGSSARAGRSTTSTATSARRSSTSCWWRSRSSPGSPSPSRLAAALASAPLADPAAERRRRGSSTRSPASPSSSCCCRSPAGATSPR